MRQGHLAKMVFVVACVCGASVVLQGCHKKGKDNSSTGNISYDFSVTGNTLVGYSVSFQSTAPSSASLVWNFGDGTTSAEASPGHVYSKADSFTVTLTVDKNAGKAVSKTIFIATPPDATVVAGIAGMKYWHGYVIADFQSASAKDTVSGLTDQFNISVLNSATLVLKNDTLGCYYTDQVNHVYYFRHVFSQYSWREVVYYYNAGSIFYTYQPDQGGDPTFGPFSSAAVLWAP